MHREHLHCVRIKHAVIWSPQRGSTVFVLVEATQNVAVSLLHIFKQVATLHSNLCKFD